MNRFHTTKTKRYEAVFIADFTDGRTIVEEIKGLEYCGSFVYKRDYASPVTRLIRKKFGIATHRVIGPQGRLP